MFSHIILFEFKDTVSHEDAFNILKGLGELINIIPEIESYNYGSNDSGNIHNKNYRYAFVMNFLSRSDRYIYQNHPAHTTYIDTYVNDFIEDAIVFDMENIMVVGENT